MIDVDIHLCLYLGVLVLSAAGALTIGLATTLVLTLVAAIVSVRGRRKRTIQAGAETRSEHAWFWRQETLPGQLGNGAGPPQVSGGYP